MEDDIKFDSKMERDYYLYLKQQREQGKIKGLSCNHPLNYNLSLKRMVKI